MNCSVSNLACIYFQHDADSSVYILLNITAHHVFYLLPPFFFSDSIRIDASNDLLIFGYVKQLEFMRLMLEYWDWNLHVPTYHILTWNNKRVLDMNFFFFLSLLQNGLYWKPYEMIFYKVFFFFIIFFFLI